MDMGLQEIHLFCIFILFALQSAVLWLWCAYISLQTSEQQISQNINKKFKTNDCTNHDATIMTQNTNTDLNVFLSYALPTKKTTRTRPGIESIVPTPPDGLC